MTAQPSRTLAPDDAEARSHGRTPAEPTARFVAPSTPPHLTPGAACALLAVLRAAAPSPEPASAANPLPEAA